MTSSVLVLYSSIASDQVVIIGQRRLETLMLSFRFDFTQIDGSEPQWRELRDKLFEVSKQRGKYPQVFIKTEDEYEFIGLWEQVSMACVAGKPCLALSVVTC